MYKTIESFFRTFVKPGYLLHKDIIEYCNQLHFSPAWKKANWRRKIKLASKAYDRFISKLDSNKVKYNLEDVVNIKLGLLFPLRIIGDFKFIPTDFILRFNISNRLGNFLTRIARKRNKFINTHDFWYLNKFKIGYNLVPLFRYNRDKVGRHDYWVAFSEAEIIINKLKKLEDEERNKVQSLG